MPAGFAIGAAGSIIGASISAGAASDAASQQAAAAQRAQDLQQKNFNTVLGNEAPFLQAGQGAQSKLNYLMGIGTPPAANGTDPSSGYSIGAGGGISQGIPGGSGQGGGSSAGGFGSLNQAFNADTFHQMSPAYQFSLQQGGQGVLNANSSGQGAMSGAALKDLTAFNSNYANNSFNNAFNQYQTQQNNIFNRLNTTATLGQNAASNNATGASAFSAGIGQSATQVGSALGAGTAAAGNVMGAGLNSAGNWLAGRQMANNQGINSNTSGAFSAGMGTTSGMAYDTQYCDYRLKCEIEPYRFNGTSHLMVYDFEFKAEPGKPQRGYIAQEVLEQYPEAVSKGPKGYLKVDYSKLPGWDELDRIMGEH